MKINIGNVRNSSIESVNLIGNVFYCDLNLDGSLLAVSVLTEGVFILNPENLEIISQVYFGSTNCVMFSKIIKNILFVGDYLTGIYVININGKKN